MDIHGVNVRECETDHGDYVLDFYKRDCDRRKVEQEIPDNYTLVERDTQESGEILVWFLEQK